MSESANSNNGNKSTFIIIMKIRRTERRRGCKSVKNRRIGITLIKIPHDNRNHWMI